MKAIRPGQWPMAVWALVCLAGVIMSSYAWIVASPTGGSPDDDFHQASIWCPSPADEHCATVPVPGSSPEVLVPQTLLASDCYSHLPDQSAACTLGLSDTVMVPTARYNTGLYPGYYYNVMHLFVGDDVDLTILTIRWVNVGLASLLYGAIFFLASPAGRRLVAYTLLGTAVPLVTFFSASINPSAWGIMGVTAAWLGLHLGLTPASKPRRIGLLSLGVAGALIAACARSDAAAYIIVVCCVLLVYHWPTIIHRLRLAIPLATASILGAAGFLSGSQSAAATQGMDFSAPVQTNSVQLFVSNLFQMPGFFTEFWNFYMGWLDTPPPMITVVLAAAVTIGLTVWGISRARMDVRGWISMLGLAAVTLGVPLLILQAGHTNVVGSGIQARYIAHLIVVFVGVCLADRRESSPGLPMAATVAFFVFISVANMYALYALIQRYVSGVGTNGFSLSGDIQWWRGGGPSPMATWVLGSVGFALMSTILFAVRREPSPGQSGTETGTQ